MNKRVLWRAMKSAAPSILVLAAVVGILLARGY